MTPALLDLLPNWEDKTQYSFHTQTTPQSWAWQFLRRNSKYRGLWEKFFYKKFHDNPGLLEEARSLVATRQRDGSMRFVKPKRNLRVLCDDANIFLNLFGTSSFPPSPAEFSPAIKFEPLKIIKNNGRGLSRIETTINEKELICVFDLASPIATQIQSAKDFIESERKTRDIIEFRMHAAKYPQYLRIIDAKLHYKKNADIAKIIFPRQDQHSAKQTVRDNYKAARKLCDHEYRLISMCRNND